MGNETEGSPEMTSENDAPLPRGVKSGRKINPATIRPGGPPWRVDVIFGAGVDQGDSWEDSHPTYDAVTLSSMGASVVMQGTEGHTVRLMDVVHHVRFSPIGGATFQLVGMENDNGNLKYAVWEIEPRTFHHRDA